MLRKAIRIVESGDLTIIRKVVASEPTFVFVMGSTGSGKNYIVNKYFKNIDLVDIDKYMAELADGGDTRKYISKSIAMANKSLETNFKKQKSIIQVGTGGNLKGLENKLIKAKSYGFKTAIILVDSGLEKSRSRNIDRANKGDQRLVPDWKVDVSYKASMANYETLKKSEYVDFYLLIKN